MIIMKPTTRRTHSVMFSYVENSKNYGEARRTWNVFYFSLQIFLELFPHIWDLGEFREETPVDLLLVSIIVVWFLLGVYVDKFLCNAPVWNFLKMFQQL